MKVKEEPIEIQASKSHIDSMSVKVKVKAEEKFSETEEFANNTSIQTTSIAWDDNSTNQT